MSSETGDQRPARLSSMATRPSEPEHLLCPRCDSNNTKFCYFNNYNLSQPRHFCKSCRRYWTRGGTLRNVPVGGGSRKSSSSSSNKRLRTTSATPSPTPTITPAATSASSSSDNRVASHPDEQLLHANPALMVGQMGSGSGPMTGSLMCCEVNLNESVAPEASSSTSLTSFLTTQGLLPPFGGGGGGFDLGLGPGLHGLGFGLGPMDWPMEPVGDQVGNGSGGSSSSAAGGCNTWQVGGDGVEGEGDCFGWPELAMSMPGKGLK
ncbi:hypothetical protein ACH5RR_035068 [Cinchona calisaya]|uniref:Dof zinc finger protein n=1 Tax=Cinchona calisaya TaxID=153742 RepID=A0ABD2YCR5_9GENT